MNADKSEAGRELDALVAEKVFGCKVERWKEWAVILNALGGGYTAVVDDDGKTILHQFPHRSMWVPHYSTDINLAWRIVEHFKGVGIGVEIHCRNRNVKVMCVSPEFVAEADTFPLAICLAALQASAPPPYTSDTP